MGSAAAAARTNPLVGLDPASADSFCELLSLHKGMGLTVVMVTHDLDDLFELSTRIKAGGAKSHHQRRAAKQKF